MLISSYAREVYFKQTSPNMYSAFCILGDAFLAHLHQHLPPMHVSECTDEWELWMLGVMEVYPPPSLGLESDPPRCAFHTLNILPQLPTPPHTHICVCVLLIVQTYTLSPVELYVYTSSLHTQHTIYNLVNLIHTDISPHFWAVYERILKICPTPQAV